MNFKNTNSERSTITRNTIDFEEKTGNVYETIVAMAKRSNQISVELKEELTSKLQEFASTTDNLEEVLYGSNCTMATMVFKTTMIRLKPEIELYNLILGTPKLKFGEKYNDHITGNESLKCE